MDIAYERLLRQRIAGEGLENPTDVVRWMGAVQAQDYAGGKWAVALRSHGSVDTDLEEAFTSGKILRTHVMRPTWHFILPEDIRWMEALTAPRVNAINAYYYRQFELDSTFFKRSNAVLTKALRGGKQLTRAELGAILNKSAVAANDLRLTFIMLRAELDAVICSGGRRGKQFTYALVDERAPKARKLKRNEALAELTARYITSHGPATVRDYCWWSGLSTADARTGLEMVKSKLNRETINGQEYWVTASAPAARDELRSVYLLPNYDEYSVGYTDRSAIFDASHVRSLDERQNSPLNYTIVSDGQIIGTWKRTLGKGSVSIVTNMFREPSKSEVKGIVLAAKRFGEYVGLPVEVRPLSSGEGSLRAKS